MGNQQSKKGGSEDPPPSIFPIGGGQPVEAVPQQRTYQTPAPAPAAVSSSAGPSSAVQSQQGQSAGVVEETRPAVKPEAPKGAVAKHDIVDNPIFDSDEEHPHPTTEAVNVGSKQGAVGNKGDLHSVPSSEGPVAPPNTPSVSKAVLPVGTTANEDVRGEQAALAGSGASATTKPHAASTYVEDKDKVASGGCLACFAGPKPEKAKKEGEVQDEPAAAAAATTPAVQESTSTAPVVVPTAAGAGEFKQTEPTPISRDVPTDTPAVRDDDNTHPHAVPLPPPPPHHEPAPEVPLEDLPVTVQGTAPEAAIPTPTATHNPLYASYDASRLGEVPSQPGEVVHRTYTSTEQSESTSTRTTTTGPPSAAVAVPMGLAAGAAAGAAGALAAAKAGKGGEQTGKGVEPEASEIAPKTPELQAGTTVVAAHTPVKPADNEQAKLHDSILSSTDITEMPGIGGSLPATPSREAGSVVTGGDVEATPSRLGTSSSASQEGQMTPLTKLQTAHEEIEDQVDVPSGKGYTGRGLGAPQSSTEIAGDSITPLKTEELDSKLKNLHPEIEEEHPSTVEYESATAEPTAATAGTSTATAGLSGAQTAEVAVGSALAAGAAAGAANAAVANKQLSKKEMLAAAKSTKKANKEAEANLKAERKAQAAALKQKEKEDREASKKKLIEEKAFKKEQRERQKQEMSGKSLKTGDVAGEGAAAEGPQPAQAPPKKESKGFLGGLFSSSKSTAGAAAASGSTASGTTSSAAAAGASGAGVGTAAGVGLAAGVAGGAAGGFLAARGIKSEKAKPGEEGTRETAVSGEAGPSSATHAPAAATAGVGAGSAFAGSSRDAPPSSGAVVESRPKLLDSGYESGALEGPLTPAASEAGAASEAAEKPKKSKARRNIDYSAIQMEKAKASTAGRLRAGYNVATGTYDSAPEPRVAPGAYSPMKTVYPALQESANQARQASIKRRASLDRTPAPRTPRVSSWARTEAVSPAGRGINSIEASMSPADYRPMSKHFA